MGPEPRTWEGRAQRRIGWQRITFPLKSCLAIATSSHAKVKREDLGKKVRIGETFYKLVRLKMYLVLDVNIFLKYSCFCFRNLAATHRDSHDGTKYLGLNFFFLILNWKLRIYKNEVYFILL